MSTEPAATASAVSRCSDWIGERVIMHADMDAFYASVEQREQPELQGRPVIVGGPRDARGVVTAASYEARAYGIHAAMPLRQAAPALPEGGVRVGPNADVLRRIHGGHADLSVVHAAG